MTTYTIKPGNIAAMCHVVVDGNQFDYVYLSGEKQPTGSPVTERVQPFAALPLMVRAAVNRHFGTVFALPLEKRGAYVDACEPWIVSEPCPFCGSTLGDDDSEDYPRCLNCGAA